MARSRKAKLAQPNICEVLGRFLEAQEERLAPKTFARYQGMVELLEDSLNGYAYQYLDDAGVRDDVRPLAGARLLHTERTSTRQVCLLRGRRPGLSRAGRFHRGIARRGRQASGP